MKLPPVKTELLERALKQFDGSFRGLPEWKGWMNNQAHRYAISANNQMYPAKKIVSLATGISVGHFSGGQPTNSYLKRHGFTIVDLPRSSKPELRFVVGQVYDRQTEIHDLFGGSRQSGISPSAQAPAIFLFTGDSGEQYGYTDSTDDNGVVSYTGEGQTGDMTLTRGNLAILQHAEAGRALHLFKSLGKGVGQEYIGEFTGASYEWRTGLDKRGQERQIVVFNLVQTETVAHRKDFEVQEDEMFVPPPTLEEARALAFAAAGTGGPGVKAAAMRTIYRRSKVIANYVIRRSGGNCESCQQPAPFMKKDGSPYLEPHHVNRVSDGGPDHPMYIGAICPSCHREIHHGLDGESKNEALKAYVKAVESHKISC
ncbi:HNH endonuclease signature motif containing protein [Pseudomonas sp. DG56-2]|uniref:HNH endonuclease n=1 Tax=Pseudomonas sp. DG56-2 TaxID=2320270 RepID=UPI0010A6B07A|nr:HNH endonuclease signature motif containing protein [Pseudomonas sp. DG56-2]